MLEKEIENALIAKLRDLKYTYRPDIHDRAALERNFRQKFEALNQVQLTDGEFARLLDQIITPDVFAAARTLRERTSFERDDGAPLFFTLVNTRDWCKNSFEVIHQLRYSPQKSSRLNRDSGERSHAPGTAASHLVGRVAGSPSPARYYMRSD